MEEQAKYEVNKMYLVTGDLIVAEDRMLQTLVVCAECFGEAENMVYKKYGNGFEIKTISLMGGFINLD